MCYVLKFEFDDSYKACKFTAFPRTFQIINYLFFKEVYNPNNVRILSSKLKQVLKSMSFQRWLVGCEESMLFKTVINRRPTIDSSLRTYPRGNDMVGQLLTQKKPLNLSGFSVLLFRFGQLFMYET